MVTGYSSRLVRNGRNVLRVKFRRGGRRAHTGWGAAVSVSWGDVSQGPVGRHVCTWLLLARAPGRGPRGTWGGPGGPGGLVRSSCALRVEAHMCLKQLVTSPRTQPPSKRAER